MGGLFCIVDKNVKHQRMTQVLKLETVLCVKGLFLIVDNDNLCYRYRYKMLTIHRIQLFIHNLYMFIHMFCVDDSHFST